MLNLSIEFFPFIRQEALIALAVLSLVILAISAWRNRRGAPLRALVLACLLGALANPSLRQENRTPLTNIAVVVLDESSSMRLTNRAERMAEIEADLRSKLANIPALEVRWVHAKGAEGAGGEETDLFTSLANATSDIPENRIAGVFLVTDGQIHDVAEAARFTFNAPIHALIPGARGEKDNRIEVVSAPRFGLVGSEQTIELKAVRSGASQSSGLATLEVRRGTDAPETLLAPFDQIVKIPIRFDHAGPNIVEVELKPEAGELTAINNKAVIEAQGIRENLKVLLVSGEPHAGERTWRNLLRSDAAVDLVHFTILRPPEKHDGTPIDQLSLIAFPTRELFAEKLNQFDLIIFDRYQRRAVLPMIYLDNVARYVEQGGAVLVAAGADYASNVSLARTPLGVVLPAQPTGRVIEEPFRPTVTPEGLRHPVTAGLAGANSTNKKDPDWGRWFRVVDSQRTHGEVVMNGAENRPLLVLDRRGQGRVALLLSDHAWLWARGFEGGGPYVDLLRRLSHWLMKEPELEEEALTAQASRNTITIDRRTVKNQVGEAIMTTPSGQEIKLTLDAREPGHFAKTVPVDEPGVYRVTMDGLRALTVSGQMNSPEFRQVVATDEPLKPVLEKTGGGAFFLGGTAGAAKEPLPSIDLVRSGVRFYGSSWAGLKARDAFEVKSISYTPLISGFVALGILAGLLMAVWYREGR